MCIYWLGVGHVRWDLFRDGTTVGMARASPDEYAARPSLKSSAKGSNVRPVAENQLHIDAMMYSDTASKDLQAITLVAAAEAKAWHSEQNTALRTLNAVLPRELEQFKFGLITLLADTICKVVDEHDLTTCGVEQSWDPAKLLKLQNERGFFVEQRDRAHWLHKCVFSFALRCMVRLLQFARGWPRGFSRLLGDEVQVNDAIATLQDDYLAFQELAAREEG